MLPTASYRSLIDAAAQVAGLPWWHGYSPGAWLEALVLQESGGNPRARRYEKHHDRVPDADEPEVDDGPLEDDASYGLMQILGTNIRSITGAPAGTSLNFGFVMRPIMGLAFGLRVLVDELKMTDQNVARALARYNGGPTGERLGPDGKMRRQVYVDGIALWAERVQRERGTP